MHTINEIQKIRTKDDFVSFVRTLALEIENSPQGWENNTLEGYLEAIASWTEDSDGFFINNNIAIPEQIEWSVLAHVLMAAAIYE